MGGRSKSKERSGQGGSSVGTNWRRDCPDWGGLARSCQVLPGLGGVCDKKRKRSAGAKTAYWSSSAPSLLRSFPNLGQKGVQLLSPAFVGCSGAPQLSRYIDAWLIAHTNGGIITNTSAHSALTFCKSSSQAASPKVLQSIFLFFTVRRTL